MDRKNYIDNLRIICILLLFPFHSAMCFNAFGEKFYVTGAPDKLLSCIVVALNPWWMALLFALAGISTVYALKKRSGKEYAKERVSRLLIPLIFGLLIVIPVQGFIGDVWNNGYNGGYFAHYIKFFTTLTDFSGNDGSFTPGNLWFILYLFIISIVVLPLVLWYNKKEKKFDFSRINMVILILSGIVIITLSTLVLDIGGKSIGDFTACFLLGFFVLSNDKVIKKLSKYSTVLGILWLILMILRVVMFVYDFKGDLIWDLQYKCSEWIGILAVLGLGAKYINKRTTFTEYFSRAVFPVYTIHQTILVTLAFFVVPRVENVYVAFLIIMTTSFIVTLIFYELLKRTSVTRFIFGIKSKDVENDRKIKSTC